MWLIEKYTTAQNTAAIIQYPVLTSDLFSHLDRYGGVSTSHHYTTEETKGTGKCIPTIYKTIYKTIADCIFTKMLLNIPLTFLYRKLLK